MKKFRLNFLCADESEYEDECVSVTVPLMDGSAQIFADHADVVAAMVSGLLRINTGEGILEYAVTDGMVQVKNGKVLILAYSAEKPEEIDVKRAEEAAHRARARLKMKHSELEYRQAQADLSRALNRLKVKRKF